MLKKIYIFFYSSFCTKPILPLSLIPTSSLTRFLPHHRRPHKLLTSHHYPDLNHCLSLSLSQMNLQHLATTAIVASPSLPSPLANLSVWLVGCGPTDFFSSGCGEF